MDSRVARPHNADYTGLEPTDIYDLRTFGRPLWSGINDGLQHPGDRNIVSIANISYLRLCPVCPDPPLALGLCQLTAGHHQRWRLPAKLPATLPAKLATQEWVLQPHGYKALNGRRPEVQSAHVIEKSHRTTRLVIWHSVVLYLARCCPSALAVRRLHRDWRNLNAAHWRLFGGCMQSDRE